MAAGRRRRQRGSAAFGPGLPALAQAPLENLNIITGFAAGGTSDAICRRVGTKLAAYAKAVVVENRTGAGGQIAINYVKGRPADGSVMLQTPTSMLTIYPHIYKKLGYDPVADLTPSPWAASSTSALPSAPWCRPA
jgi:tripartite-type tricarboxylate transporter receptor subunit TctC